MGPPELDRRCSRQWRGFFFSAHGAAVPIAFTSHQRSWPRGLSAGWCLPAAEAQPTAHHADPLGTPAAQRVGDPRFCQALSHPIDDISQVMGDNLVGSTKVVWSIG
jgi:hypothetical protein